MEKRLAVFLKNKILFFIAVFFEKCFREKNIYYSGRDITKGVKVS
jgi:hypothetical protein